ncbi:UNVERIFIED_CONTAM: nucleotidyltransferase domain-containing protein [Halobacillus marinus]|uniref:nucleotidyltransferase domain-containing protein n=1 Tax=Halobacillus sp. BAB-2008 TaxID=1246484 RepID=UPI0002A4FA98|nr:nucleotidyltransferase domain-containing protein [Halobacillus sp. BAB-2008]ELK44870.1 hypothetical protein D479_17504 [Halobacillus sp. BAB-2008]
MALSKRLEPLEAVKRIIDERFPACDAAIVAGSVIRGEGTATSDLDIVLFERERQASYRTSFFAYGWPMEVFVHSFLSYENYFESDRERGQPSLQQMVSEGTIVRDAPELKRIREEAKQVLLEGPDLWSESIIREKRYFITDLLEDFIGCSSRDEGIFIAGSLAERTGDFILRTNKCWSGSSKWLLRALKRHDPTIAGQFSDAFDRYYRNGEKESVIQLVDEAMVPHGGRLFEGFSIGKDT